MRNVLLLVLLLISVSVQAGMQQDFDAGIKAFKQGDYAKAARLFEKAQQAGMHIPALYYNLGVSYYRLERYKKSEQAFLQASQFPEMAPLAYYNLGLVSKKTGNLLGADKWFRLALDTSQDKKLRTLARRALENNKKVASPQATKKWWGYVSAGLGYDDNVTLDNDALINASSQSDQFLELYGYTRGLLSNNKYGRLYFKGSVFADFYQDLDIYDYVDMNAGLYQRFNYRDWRNEAGLYLTYSTLGGDSYLRSGNISLTARRNISDTTRLRLKLRLRDISAIDSRYRYLDGSSHDLRVEGRWKLAHHDQFRTYYEIQFNDRNDRTTATTFTSFSPLRQRIRADYTFDIKQGWEGRVAAEYRNSDYADTNIDAGGIEIRRKDDRLRAFLEATKKINRDTSTTLSYTYTDNSSNIDRYTYKRNVLMANVNYSF